LTGSRVLTLSQPRRTRRQGKTSAWTSPTSITAKARSRSNGAVDAGCHSMRATSIVGFSDAGFDRLYRIVRCTALRCMNDAPSISGDKSTEPSSSPTGSSSSRGPASYAHRASSPCAQTGDNAMRYYFDLRDGSGVVTDDEGLDLPTLAAVQKEAR